MWYKKKKKEKTPLFKGTVSVKKKPNLEEKLDRVFSEFIRLRDSDDQGYARCISCGKIVHWKDIHCGHFVNRWHQNTRFNEKNCNGQCINCNSFDEGNNIGYTRGIIKKYGYGVIDELEIQKHQYKKYSAFEYEILIKHYQQKVKELHANKGI